MRSAKPASASSFARREPRPPRSENSENIYKLPLTPQTLTRGSFYAILELGYICYFRSSNPLRNFSEKPREFAVFCYQLTFFGKETHTHMATSHWISRENMEHLLAACMPENREALRLSMDYGLRIGDVLRMPSSALTAPRWSFKEEKTGKRRRVTLSAAHKAVCASMAGKVYVFEHRLDPLRHRTRQAVWKDLKRIARMYRLESVSPHSARKTYSVERYRQSGGDLAKVQRLLNHSDEAVTALYALADQLSLKNPPPLAAHLGASGAPRSGEARKRQRPERSGGRPRERPRGRGRTN